jgi:hypothetical protein
VKRFSRLPPVHRPQPVDDLRQPAVLRHRDAGGVAPLHALGRRLPPRPAPRKEAVPEPVQAPVRREAHQEPGHARQPRLLSAPRPAWHERLGADLARRPLPRWSHGSSVRRAWAVCVGRVWGRLSHHCHRALTVRQAVARPGGRGLAPRGRAHKGRFFENQML